jgi:integrase/recombinase XerD
VIVLKVHEVLVNSNGGQQTRYILVDGGGQPVIPVIKYLKYLDNLAKAPNTLRSYCYHLKLYFEFLSENGISYDSIGIDDLSKFIGWLRSSHKSTKVTPIQPTQSARSERTINTILTCVLSFYDYLDRQKHYENDFSESSTKKISSKHRLFKPFLHHVTKSKKIDKNILKLKNPKRNIKTLTQEDVQLLHNSCTNIRDELLIRVLYEGGLRISEALSLEIENFNINKNSIKVTKSKTSAGENRTVFLSQNTMNLFQDYLIDFHGFDVDSNYVFIKLKGKNRGKQLDRSSVESLIKRVRKKTGIKFTPHMLRHSFATELHEKGVEISIIQKLLGHAQVQTTINTYVHVSDELIRKSYTNAMNNKKNTIQKEESND